jgi:hypothetical protein
MCDVLSTVVRGLGPDLTASQVRAVERELDHQLLDLSPADEGRIRAGLVDAERVRRMRLDDDIPSSLTALVEACRVPSEKSFVSAMNRVIEEVSMDDLQVALSTLQARYPSVWTAVRTAVAIFSEQSRRTEPVPVPTALVEAFNTRSGLPDAHFMGFLLSSLVVTTVIGMLGVWLVFGRVPLQEDDPLTAVFVAPGSVAVGVSLVGGYLVDLVMKRRAAAAEVDGFRALAAEFSLFPSEICRAIWDATDGELQGPELERRLHGFELQPRWLFELWSEGLATRLLNSRPFAN